MLGVSTAEEAVELYKQTNKIMELAGMKMQKWATNCELLRRTLKQNGETLPTESHWTKVLGLYWNTKEDKLSVNLDSVLKTDSPGNTKRVVLQTTSRIFDPLGFLSPFTIRAKMLFQRFWTQGLDWDTSLPEPLSDKWCKWVAEIGYLRLLHQPTIFQ